MGNQTDNFNRADPYTLPSPWQHLEDRVAKQVFAHFGVTDTMLGEWFMTREDQWLQAYDDARA